MRGDSDDSLLPNGEVTKFDQLKRALGEILADYGLVRFIPLAVEDKEAMLFLLGEVDRANGFVFGGLTEGNESIIEAAVSDKTWDDFMLLMQERYFSHQPPLIDQQTNQNQSSV